MSFISTDPNVSVLMLEKGGKPKKKKKASDEEAEEDSDDGDEEGRELDYISDTSEYVNSVNFQNDQ